ncbi:MAG: PLP-dependent transferase [Lentisphaerae bacterium]|nr:PLP-dependent transferase [Lentisphaerota bacterium]MCP4102449.1 PLP-dependent transferase [Lentisphaerota bacterium]
MSMQIKTKCVHSGECPDLLTGGVNTPVYPSTAHKYLNAEDVYYPRYFNTFNQDVIVKKICELEGAENGVIFSSGMAAVTTALLTFLKKGDHIVLQDEIYGGSHAFVDNFCEQFGISFSFVSTDAEAIRAAIRPETRVVYIESPTNPLLSIVDIRKVGAAAKEKNCVSIIDNTFASPINQNPFELGIDVVIHSGTKYLGGHSDLTCGAVVTSDELAEKIRKTATTFGGNLNPLSCYILQRSLKTLSIRVNQQTQNAMLIADFLDNNPNVEKVFYPGLSSHPGNAIAAEQMNGFGAMLSFEIKNPEQSANEFMRKLKLIRPAVSLGGLESTICDPASTSHVKVSAEVRKRQGITDRLLRLSIGIEDAEDLIQDLKQAFEV